MHFLRTSNDLDLFGIDMVLMILVLGLREGVFRDYTTPEELLGMF